MVFFQILESFHLVSHWLMEEWRQPKFLSMWVHTVDLYYHRKEILEPVYYMLPLAWIKRTLGWFNANSDHMGTVEPKSWNYCITFLHFGNELNFIHAALYKENLYCMCMSAILHASLLEGWKMLLLLGWLVSWHNIMWAGYVVVILDKAWVILYWWFIEAWLNLQIADVAQAIVNAIHEDESIGQTFELVG